MHSLKLGMSHTRTHTDKSTHTKHTSIHKTHAHAHKHKHTHAHKHTHTHTPSFNLRNIWDIKVTIKEIEVLRGKKVQRYAILTSAPNGNRLSNARSGSFTPTPGEYIPITRWI